MALSRDKLRKGEFDTSDFEKIAHLHGRFDATYVLEGLGIAVSHWLNEDQVMCHCPNPYNHSNGDQNPSFGFNRDKLAYNCFVCGGGSLLKLTMEQLDLPEDDAIAWLEQHSDMEPMETDRFKEEVEKLMRRDQEEPLPSYPLSILTDIRDYPNAKAYMNERGITDEVLEEFRIGVDSEHGAVAIPHFWNGKLVGMQYRHLIENDGVYYCQSEYCEGKVAKYKNTPNFPKKNTLYNYRPAIEMARRGWGVTVVESPMTVMYAKSIGVHLPHVATFGSWSVEQAMSLVGASEVNLWPDNDPAGFENLMRVEEVLSQYTTVNVIPLVPGEKADPSDLPDLETYLRYMNAAYPASLLPMTGLVIGV